MTPALAILVAGISATVGGTIGWLTAGGAVAAAAVGSLILVGGGLPGAGLLAVFFVSGSLLTYTCNRVPRSRLRGRTWKQVIANGGVGAVGALLVPSSPATGWAVLTGALAAAQADTWATEIGTTSPRAPRLITSGREVPAGTSGAVTTRGTLASLAGALTMGGCALLFGIPWWTACAAAVGGAVGSLGDSVLGATVQAHYQCDTCGQATEWSIHGCGRQARHVGGVRWIDNDAVNLAATAVGALVALGMVATVG